MKYLKIPNEVKERVSQKAMNNEEMEPHELAVLLIMETEAALASGTKHYNRAGKLLTEPEEIIRTLRDEGEVTFQPVKVDKGAECG